MIRQLINEYFEFRGYDDPNRLQALLFLISEVGELVEAYRELFPADIEEATPQDKTALQATIEAGRLADRTVSGQSAWVRSNGRLEKSADLAGEVADVLMMLDRFSLEADLETPAACLMKKMERKGFNVDDSLNRLINRELADMIIKEIMEEK
jgi:NTP pyrophosphatase (non-canonical NTP hydrolase)